MNYYYDTEFLEGTQRKTFFGIPNEKMFILIMGNMVNTNEVEKFDVKINN